ncbi:MAG: c-type cytochrome, partial [Planctomycetia bacterium]
LIWRQMEPIVEAKAAEVVRWISTRKATARSTASQLTPLVAQRLTATKGAGRAALLDLLEHLLATNQPAVAAGVLNALHDAALSGEMKRAEVKETSQRLHERLMDVVTWRKGGADDAAASAALGLLLLNDNLVALETVEMFLADPAVGVPGKTRLLRTLAMLDQPRGVELVLAELDPKALRKASAEWAGGVVQAVERLQTPQAAAALLAAYPVIAPQVRPQVLDALTSRPAWAGVLLDAVEAKTFPAAQVSVNHVRRLQQSTDAKLVERAVAVFGKVRANRDPAREQLVATFRAELTKAPGDPAAGKAIYAKVCAQCHQFRGEGYTVGPKLDDNGQGSLDQFLSNLLDPNLVIGKDYQARVVATTDGRLLTGLVVEDSPERVVLKVAGGKQEVVPKGDVEAMRTSEVSLMPEGVEKQIGDQGFRDLVAYLRSTGDGK